MRIHPEIKEFTKNTLIFTLFFTLVINLGWDYITPYLSPRASADNEKNFQATDVTYMGNIATALSLNIGRISLETTEGKVGASDELASISEILARSSVGEDKLIAVNTNALQSYINVLRTDIVSLLDTATDRANELDEHIELLKAYYIRTNERLMLLSEQSRELQTVLADATNRVEGAKVAMEEKYRSFEYDGIDSVIDTYVSAKEEESRARVYLTYIERFQRGYTVLQGQNKKILDTLINNREALIKRAVVIVPDSGSDMLRDLGLIVSESEFKATNTQE